MSMNTNRKDKNILNVTEQPDGFVENTLDYEQYALIYSENYEKIMGKTHNETDQDYWAGLVKISSDAIGSKSVYRKCRAYSGIKSQDVALGYRTQQTLFPKDKVDMERKIKVEKAHSFCYLWNQFDTEKKYGFRATMYGIGATIVLSLISIILTMVFAC